MTIEEISLDRYAGLYAPDMSVYDSPEFISLNAPKVKELRIFALCDNEGRALVAQAFGRRGEIWAAPFSAPFSMPVRSAEAADEDVGMFYHKLSKKAPDKFKITFPALCYGEVFIPEGEQVNDFNYHYPLTQLADYESHLSRSGRYSHRRAQRHDFQFLCTDDCARAYEIIRRNREAMGYPLAMTLEQVKQTAPITRARYFVLTLDGRDMAAAIVFQPLPNIAQVIYWGDIPEAREYRAMNSLPWHLFNWYAAHMPEIDTVDIGPSSTDGVLNRGLADYKLSIGCIETPKPTVIL